jgi:hypothetical protein
VYRTHPFSMQRAKSLDTWYADADGYEQIMARTARP